MPGRRILHTVTRLDTVSSSVLLLLASGCAAIGAKPHADLILFNGDIWTVNARQPTAEAVAILNGRFAAVGTDREVLRLRGPDTRVIDLQGWFALPGSNDSHVHFASAARFLEFNIMATTTQKEFVERLRDVASVIPKGEWIPVFRQS